MSAVLWNTLTIKVPAEMVELTKTGKVSLRKTLTKVNNNISKSQGKPSIRLISADIKKPEIINEGKTWNIAELKETMKKAKELEKKNISKPKPFNQKLEGKIIKRAKELVQQKAVPKPIRSFTDTHQAWRDALAEAGVSNIPAVFTNHRLKLTKKRGALSEKALVSYMSFNKEDLKDFKELDKNHWKIEINQKERGIGNKSDAELKQGDAFDFLKQLANKPKPSADTKQYVEVNLKQFNKNELLEAVRPYWNYTLMEKLKKDLIRRNLEDKTYFNKIEKGIENVVRGDLETLVNMEKINMKEKPKAKPKKAVPKPYVPLKPYTQNLHEID